MLDSSTPRLLNFERRHRQLLLAHHPQRRAAGDEGLDRTGGDQQPGDLWSRGQDLFEVVEHEQEPLPAQKCRELIRAALAAPLSQANRLRDGRNDQIAVVDSVEGDEGHTVGKVIGGLRCGGQCQPGFADAAGTGQGEQAHRRISESGEDPRHLRLPANEGRKRFWQRRRVGGARKGDNVREGMRHDRSRRCCRIALELFTGDAIGGAIPRRGEGPAFDRTAQGAFRDPEGDGRLARREDFAVLANG